MKIKKTIAFILTVCLIMSLTVMPSMAASDSYLANQTKYYAVDFEKDAYTAGNTITALSDEGSNVTYNSTNMITTIVSDAVKGGKSMKIEKKAGAATTQFYFGTAFGSNTIAAGDRLCFELSVKAESLLYLALKDELAGSIALGGLYYGLASWPAGTTLTTPKLITANEWHHMVYEIVPGTSNGTVIVYLDGTTIGSATNTALSIANLTTKLNSYKLYVNGNGNLIDDVKFWKSTTAYDATAAGDVAGITSTSFSVADDKIVYGGASTLAELRTALTASENGSFAFITADNIAVADESVAVNETYKVVARSASGSTVKIYALEEIKLVESNTYTIENGLIKGVAANTTVADFLSNLTPAGNMSVIDENGDAVTEGSVSMGMKLVAQSGAMSSEYIIDCAELTITPSFVGTETKLNSVDFEVAFEGTGTVEFYVNDSSYPANENTPNVITVTHEAEGEYVVYAKVTFAGNIEIETERITYSYMPNQKPVVEISGVSNGAELSSEDTFTITVNATDADGTITGIELYVDGERMVYTEPVTVGPLSLGRHEFYATATDNEGATTQSGKCYVKVVTKTRKEVFFHDFNDGSSWSSGDVVTLEGEDESYGKVFKVASDTGTKKVSKYNGDTTNLPDEGIMEFDMRLDNTEMMTLIMLRHGNGTSLDWNVYVKSGKLCDSNISILPDVWYHYKLEWDAGARKMNVFVKDNETGEYLTARENMTFSTDGKIGGFEFVFREGGAAVPYVAELDNINVYYYQRNPMFETAEYLNADGENVFESNEARYDLKDVTLNFNNKLKEDTVTKENVTVLLGDAPVTDYTLAVSGKSITVTFDKDIKTLSDYKVVYKNLKDSFDVAIADGYVEFETGSAIYDCIEWVVKKSGEVINSTDNIEKGDVLTLSAKLINKSDQTKNSTLVFAVYIGKTLAGYSMASVSLPAGQTKIFTTTPLTVSSDANGDICAFGDVWSGITTAERTVEIPTYIRENQN